MTGPLGWAGTIQLRPGQAASRVFSLREEIASVYDVHASSVILSPADSERRARIEVYDRNPLQTAHVFTVPTLDTATGQCVIGHDTLGRPVHWRMWRDGWGSCHGLVFGTTGSGKSSLVELLMTEARHSSLAVTWFLDPEEGLSAPAWIDGADHYAGTDDAGTLTPIRAALQALERVWAHRRHAHAADRATWQHPTTEWPLILVVVDESPDVLADPESARIVKLLLRKGRKCGIALVLIAQVPSLAELGGDQTIRSMAASLNVLAFRTSDRMSAHMGMPKVLPVDPVTLPEEWPDGTSTAGLAYHGRGQQIRTTWVQDPWPWARTGQPATLDEGSARAAGGDYLIRWLRRAGRDTDADQLAQQHRLGPAAAPDTAATEEDGARVVHLADPLDPAGTVQDRALAVLAEVGTATTGIIHRHLVCDGRPHLSQVSRALKAAAAAGECLDLGHGRWGALHATLPTAAGDR